MKKALLIGCLVCALAAQEAGAIGLGVQVGAKASDNIVVGPSLLIGFLHGAQIGIDWMIHDDFTLVGLTMDWFPLGIPITEVGPFTMGFLAGVGIFVDGVFYPEENLEDVDSESFSLNGGVRIPLRLDFEVGSLVLFFEVAPAINVEFTPSFGFGGMKGTSTSLGVKFYFD